MSLRKSLNILVAGVGGQGVVLLSDIIAEVFLITGHNIGKSELRGIAKRSGSIISHLRIGKTMHSPLIPKGKADIFLAMELLEAYRWVDYLKKNGLLIMLDRKTPPLTMTCRWHRYPKDLINKIKAVCKNLEEIRWIEINRHLVDIRFANMFMLGVFSNHFHFAIKDWKRAMRKKLPPESIDLNLTVFSTGRRKLSNRSEVQKFDI